MIKAPNPANYLTPEAYQKALDKYLGKQPELCPMCEYHTLDTKKEKDNELCESCLETHNTMEGTT